MESITRITQRGARVKSDELKVSREWWDREESVGDRDSEELIAKPMCDA